MSDMIFGQDLALDAAGAVRIAANGEPVLTDGPGTGTQDVRLRLFTRLGELFYDIGFGSLLHDWIRQENTLATRMALEAEVERRVAEDPRVKPLSARCRVTHWDESGLTVEAAWEFIGSDHRENLVLRIDNDKLQLVVEDVRPR